MQKKTAVSCAISAIIAIVISSNLGNEIRTGEAGLKLIGNAEGCMSTPYYCPANVLTVGVGSTTGFIDPEKLYSDEEIARKWVDDIEAAERCVNQFADGDQLPQEAFEAVTSITFNVGCTKMQNSTMFKLLNVGDLKTACNEFPRWVYSGQKKLPGLITRREAEKEHCLSGLINSEK